MLTGLDKAKNRQAIALLSAVLGMTLVGAGAAGAAGSAHMARLVSLNESGRLHLTSKHGFTLNEQGSTTGTIGGAIYIHLHLVSNSEVTSEVNIYPRGGSLSGAGTASYHVNGAFASFAGSLSLTRGTGSYSHAHASKLRFTGTIQRRGDAVTVQLSGPLSV